MNSGRLFALLAALLPAAASAQDAPQQTVAGAQEFLRLATSQFGMNNSHLTAGETFFVHTNIRFEPVSDCVSKVGSDLKWRYTTELSDPTLNTDQNFDRYKAVVLRGSTMTGAALANWHEQMEPARLPREINWGSVSSVIAVSAKVYGAPDDVKRVVVIHSKPAMALFAPDAALAARLAYAGEFLRAACDKSAETGF